jgi:4-amino-4-deoxy-L-arabinose transferase-like glycosyltransferase
VIRQEALRAPAYKRLTRLLQRVTVRPTVLELFALGLVLSLAVAMRLPQLNEPANNYDEGVYLESLLLFARGYAPFAEIAVSQGPLHLHTQLPFFLLFGQTVAAGRAASAGLSLVGLVGIWWVGREVGGRWAGLGAALLLAISPTYLRFSRQALAELPALAPTILAIGAALLYSRTGRTRWLVVAGLLAALGLLMKPIVVPAALGLVWLVWRPNAAGWRSLLLLAAVVLAAIALVLVLLGPGPVLGQVLGFREAAREEQWSLLGNWAQLVDKLDQESYGFYLLALTGLVPLAQRAGRRALAATALWAVASLALLLVHSPLSYHHMVILLPPLAVLAATAVSSAPRSLTRGGLSTPLLGTLVLTGVLVYASGLPRIVQRDLLLLDNIDAAGAGSHRTDDEISAAERIRSLTRPDDFVLTDNPYLAFLAGRRVPPELVDPSDARLHAGDLTDDEVLALVQAYDPEVIVLWNGKLSRLREFMSWVSADYALNRRFGTVDDGEPRAILRDRIP